MTEAPDEVIRIHEAGHAVARLSVSVPIRWIDCYVKDGAPLRVELSPIGGQEEELILNV